MAGEAQQPRSDLASLGIYVFSRRRCSTGWTSAYDFGAHVVPAMLEGGARVFGYRFDGYWQDVGTIDSYWRAHMELLEDHPALDLYDRDWVIHTRSEERAPGRIGATATSTAASSATAARSPGPSTVPCCRRASASTRARSCATA